MERAQIIKQRGSQQEIQRADTFMTWDAYKIQKWHFVCFPCAAWYHMLSSLCCHSESGRTIYFPFQINLVILVRCRKQINYIRRLSVSINQEACHFPGLDPHERKWGGGGRTRNKGGCGMEQKEDSCWSCLRGFSRTKDHGLDKHTEKQLPTLSFWSFSLQAKGTQSKRRDARTRNIPLCFRGSYSHISFFFWTLRQNDPAAEKGSHIQQLVFKYIPTGYATYLGVPLQNITRYLWS